MAAPPSSLRSPFPSASSATGSPASGEVPLVVGGTGVASDPPAEITSTESLPTATSDRPAASSNQGSTDPVRDCRWVWDIPFDRVTLEGAIDRIEDLVRRGEPRYIITANLNYAMLHHRQPGMPEITRDAAMILADGQPIVWRSRLGANSLPTRVAGSEMIYDLAERCRDRGWGIYFLGGQPGVAQACADQLAQIYPQLKISGVESPPFRDLTDQEQAEQDARIRESGAKVLLVAFGQPKGERWIHEHYQRLGIPVSIQLGASFDFIAGTATRAPEIWQTLGMEWFYRMASDPKRLVPRYASNIRFLIGALIEDWKRKVTGWGMGQWTEPTE